MQPLQLKASPRVSAERQGKKNRNAASLVVLGQLVSDANRRTRKSENETKAKRDRTTDLIANREQAKAEAAHVCHPLVASKHGQRNM